MLFLGLLVICAGALFTFVGMSSPLLTGLFGKASQVETSFYNKVNLPVAVGIALFLGITPFLGWSEEGLGKILKRLWLSLALTTLACVIAYVGGVTAWTHMLLVAASVFALVSNAIALFRQYRTGWTSLGGPLSHIGVALLLIGIVGSGAYDETVRLLLKPGEPQQAFGYSLTFLGITEQPGEKPVVSVQVSDGRTGYVATPKLYFSEYNQAMMREPDIKVLPLKDLYLSPLEVRMAGGGDGHNHGAMVEMTKGETKDIAGYQVEFVRFDVGTHGQTAAMGVGAVLNVSVSGTRHEVIPQLLFHQNGEREVIPAELPSLHLPSKGMMRPQIALQDLNVEQKKVMLELLSGDAAPAGHQELIVEVSAKPLMMVVWTGVVLIILGTAIAWRRRMAAEPA
jgi:cytochrome c-type biogenesis protein CcmF